jgi:phosphatidylinositol glycan class V
LINLVLALGPFAAFQWYAYTTFCHLSRDEIELAPAVVRFGEKEGLVMPGAANKSEWCAEDLPLSYSYVQSHYWKIGFLKYWEMKQVPQFGLAAPVIGEWSA